MKQPEVPDLANGVVSQDGSRADLSFLPAEPTSSIATRLLRLIFVSYFVVTLVVTCVQLLAEYRNTESRIQREIEAMQQTFGPGIGDAVWRFQTEVLHGILEGIKALPTVDGVLVEDETGRIIQSTGRYLDRSGRAWESTANAHVVPGAASQSLLDQLVPRQFPVVYADEHGKRWIIGHWTVFSNRRMVVEQVQYGFMLILVNSIVKTLVLWFIFLYVVRRWLARPLQDLSHFVHGLRLDNLDNQVFRLRDGGNHELHYLAGSINAMLARLNREQSALRALNETLEERVQERTEELEAMNRQLESLSATDGLTGIANRRQFDEVLASEWARAMRVGLPIALAMVDIDHFKAYNDRYGHPAGDACLRLVARLLRDAVRRNGELVARYGGEEFAIIAPGIDAEQVRSLAIRLREDMAALAIPHDAAALGRVSLSVGVVALVPAKGQTAALLVECADLALYRAKHQGRDQVVVFDAVAMKKSHENDA